MDDDHKSKTQIAADVVTEYLIGLDDMAMVYISPDPFGSAFEEELDLRKVDLSAHRTAGLCFFEKDGRLYLASMAPSTPGARIPRWRTRIRGAWLKSTPRRSLPSRMRRQSSYNYLRMAHPRAFYSSRTRKSHQTFQIKAFL
jgi:hypothetical protein